MKKAIIYIMIIMGAVSTASAQQGFNIGVQGGGGLPFLINQTNMGFTNAQYDYAPKGAYAGGLEAGYNFTNHIGVQVEANLARIGQNYTYKGDVTTQKF